MTCISMHPNNCIYAYCQLCSIAESEGAHLKPTESVGRGVNRLRNQSGFFLKKPVSPAAKTQDAYTVNKSRKYYAWNEYLWGKNGG